MIRAEPFRHREIPGIVDVDRDRVRAGAKSVALRIAPPVARLVAERDRLRATRDSLTDRLRAANATIAGLNEDKRELNTELARARAGDLSRFDTLQYLFVITYGRSGSTLLQGILNSIPGYLIRGENRDALYHLGTGHRALDEARKHHDKAVAPWDSWYGIGGYEPEVALQMLRTTVLTTLLKPEADTRVIGYKEIRWWHHDWAAHLRFLQAAFPGARFVINTRSHEKVSQSKWWADVPDALGALAAYEEQLDRMEKVLGESVYRLHFDDYLADPGLLEGFFDWLGEPFDRAAVEAVMAIRHSS